MLLFILKCRSYGLGLLGFTDLSGQLRKVSALGPYIIRISYPVYPQKFSSEVYNELTPNCMGLPLRPTAPPPPMPVLVLLCVNRTS